MIPKIFFGDTFKRIESRDKFSLRRVLSSLRPTAQGHRDDSSVRLIVYTMQVYRVRQPSWRSPTFGPSVGVEHLIGSSNLFYSMYLSTLLHISSTPIHFASAHKF